MRGKWYHASTGGLGSIVRAGVGVTQGRPNQVLRLLQEVVKISFCRWLGVEKIPNESDVFEDAFR